MLREPMKTRNIVKMLSTGFIVVLLGLGCSKEQQNQQQPPASVSVVVVQPRTIPAEYRYVAQTEGSLQVEVRAQVSGIMQDFFFKEGGLVSKGQRLFQIDPRPFQISYEQAIASLASAEALLDQAQRRFARIKPLHEENAVSKQDYDDAQAAQSTAQANVMVSKAAVNAARLNLTYSRVEAPISGIAGMAIPSRGSLVAAQQTLLTNITRVDPMYVNFGLSDQNYRKMMKEIAEGRVVAPADGRLMVTLILSDNTVYPMTGFVNFQDIRIDNQTSTIQTRAEMPNPSVILRPGQYVTVSLTGMTRPNAITIPQKAVLEGQMGKFVFVVNDKSQVEIRPIKVGDWYKDQWIVNEGLKAKDKVITEGFARLAPGAPVQIVSVGQEGKPAAQPQAAPQQNKDAEGNQVPDKK